MNDGVLDQRSQGHRSHLSLRVIKASPDGLLDLGLPPCPIEVSQPSGCHGTNQPVRIVEHGQEGDRLADRVHQEASDR